MMVNVGETDSGGKRGYLSWAQGEGSSHCICMAKEALSDDLVVGLPKAVSCLGHCDLPHDLSPLCGATCPFVFLLLFLKKKVLLLRALVIGQGNK